MVNRNRQVVLKRRPSGAPTTADFEIVDGPMPEPGDGEVLVRGIYLSLDRDMVSEYNDVEPRPGPNLIAAVRKRLKIQGFIVSDQWQRFGEYRAMPAPLVRNGELKYREDIVEGLDRAPDAFIGLLEGRNFGKLLVKLGDDPTAGS
jgi:NADPH-dependent curcumin reductase CurA